MIGAGITDLMHQRVTGHMPAAARCTLPGIPASVAAARRFVGDNLAGCPRAGDLVLAVSELASNALAWSASGCGGTFTVCVHTAPTCEHVIWPE